MVSASPADGLEMVKFLSSLGVGGAIAGVLFFFYRKDVKQFTDLWATQAELNREMTERMIAVVIDNTRAFTQNTEVVKSLHKRLDLIERRGRNDDTPNPADPQYNERRRDHKS